MPFAGYSDFDDCVAQNGDKNDPAAYCGAIKHKVEGMSVVKNLQQLLVKQPRPGLVPQSGDPQHPGRWVRPEGEQQRQPGPRRAPGRETTGIDADRIAGMDTGAIKDWLKILDEQSRRGDLSAQNAEVGHNMQRELRRREGQKAVKGIVNLLVKAETCK